MLKWSFMAAIGLALASSQALAWNQNSGANDPPQFRRGINILGYDPLWKDPAKGRFKLEHFSKIRSGGFDFVRVNLFVFDHMDGDNVIQTQWLKRLDWVVANATEAGLSVILDEHDFGVCAKDVALCRSKLASVWRQLAIRYRREPANVAFELLNEPHGNLDVATWNAMIPELLAIVRATNPTRTVIIGPSKWSSPSMLPTLRLPANDRHIMVTFHYYGPYRFTHQGAPWSKISTLSGVTWGSAADHQTLRDHFDKIGVWARTSKRPLLVGEFGVFDRSGTPLEMRAKYIAAVACQSERHGFGWAYWQFDGNFIAWDMKRDSWVEPIKTALTRRPTRAGRC